MDKEKNYEVVFAGETSASGDGNSGDNGDGIRLIIPEEFATYHEEIMYNSDFRATLRMLEMRLHKAEDPKYIISVTVKTGCLFYDADWCGILIADWNMGMWGPKIWYDRTPDGMTDTLFREFEYFEHFPRWVASLDSGEPIVIRDVETIREIDPEEYENYKRLHAEVSSMHPLGRILPVSHDKAAHKVPGELIVNRNGYCLNPDLAVTTDFQEMENMWQQAQIESVLPVKIELLKKAFQLYTASYMNPLRRRMAQPPRKFLCDAVHQHRKPASGNACVRKGLSLHPGICRKVVAEGTGKSESLLLACGCTDS